MTRQGRVLVEETDKRDSMEEMGRPRKGPGTLNLSSNNFRTWAICRKILETTTPVLLSFYQTLFEALLRATFCKVWRWKRE